MTFAVGRPLGLLYVMYRQAALAACLSFGATRSYAACLVLATFGTYTLPLSVPNPAHASKLGLALVRRVSHYVLRLTWLMG